MKELMEKMDFPITTGIRREKSVNKTVPRLIRRPRASTGVMKMPKRTKRHQRQSQETGMRGRA